MKKFRSSKDIWILEPQEEDLLQGAHYALISLHWTFNRMMLNKGPAGQNIRAVNIAKGIVAQEMLKRALEKKGVKAVTQRKSHRDDDLFDFRVQMGNKLTRLDLKTWNYFTDYDPLGRTALSAKHIENNANYSGSEWTHFFPMLVPHTQIGQDKEAYCFAIASSIDFRKDVFSGRSGEILAAFPSGEILPFLSSPRLCLAREEDGKGIYLSIRWEGDMFTPDLKNFIIVGEWNGKLREESISVKNRSVAKAGPFSIVSSFKINQDLYRKWNDGIIRVSVFKNEFKDPVLNAARININVPPQKELELRIEDFCNLVIPDDYKLFVIGWTAKEDFLLDCRKYPAWVWPNDSVDKYRNQPWSQITARDAETFAKAGFTDCLKGKPPKFNAGWLKTTGSGGGACCYVYPNIGMKGGVRETNLYTLAQDVNTLESIC